MDLGPVRARFLVWGQESGGGFSLVEHSIPPRHLAAPLHRHSREDEYSYVLEGFTMVLSAVKALLEHDIILTVVADRFPKDLDAARDAG